MTNKPSSTPTLHKKFYLISALIALVLTLLTSFSVTVIIRALAGNLLQTLTDEALIELFTPLKYLRFHISFIPTIVGTLLVSLPVHAMFKTKDNAIRVCWGLVVLLILCFVWIISLFTLRIGLVSTVKIILTLLKTLLKLI